jgi:phosphoribosylformylglycinamidine cyclo-ligase
MGAAAPSAPRTPWPLRYRDAGVDTDATDAFVGRLMELTRETRDARVLSDFSAFAGMYLLDLAGIEEPVLVATTDGVGTKLAVAQACGRHDTVGIDLVAMSANDLITCGARPLLFLDYLATGRFAAAEAEAILSGIVDGCKQAGMVLIGGETAEMPGFYRRGEYDLAGFAVGIADRRRLVDPRRIRPGDVVLGARSSGLHSNGYSLARKALLTRAGLDLSRRPRGLGATLADELLRPTRIYVKLVGDLVRRFDVHAVAHITGGGLPGNIRRLLPAGCRARLWRESWPAPPIFDLIRRCGRVPDAEMFRTFNMGIGLALVVGAGDAEAVVRAAGGELIRIGRIEAGEVDVDVE